jgi:hypothetical protein
MKLFCARLRELVMAAACYGAAQANLATAGDVPAPAIPGTNALRSLPDRPGKSPVETFRKLLKMAPEERERFLINYAPANREKILAKVDEYSMLPPDFSELRLRVTELRWYLIPLLKTPPEERAEKLKLVPEPCREWIVSRLDEWDMWPSDLKQEVLEYESTMHYFVGRNAEVQPQPVFEDLPEKQRPALERKLAEWRSLPLEQRKQMYGGFQHYFELSEDEKQKILDAVFEPQRQETEKVVGSIEKRSKADRDADLAAFHRFAEMSPAEWQTFMKSAERWEKMSPAERQAWRDLVHQLSTQPASSQGAVLRPMPTAPVIAPAAAPSR